jgi:hypothetical protein
VIEYHDPDPWRLPSPEPGGPIAVAVELRCPRVRDYGAARLLHAALHAHWQIGHDQQSPYALALPRSADPHLWLICLRAELLRRLPERVRIGRDTVDLLPGLRAILRARPQRPAGEHRAVVRTLSPLVLRQSHSGIAGSHRRALQDQPASLVGSLLQVGLRLGLDVRSSDLVADVVSYQLRRVEERERDGLTVGGHWQVGDRRGRIACMEGWLAVRCNAPARWLLDCAELLGLGSKTALGFGRLLVEAP